jgi:bifunctional DNase/RNase
MVDLTVHAMLWCAQHGHPVLTLRAGQEDRHFAVAIAAEDAQAMALWQHADGRPHRIRLLELIETMLAGLGARLTEVRLRVGVDGVLRASVRLDRGERAPGGALELSAHFADAIVLARRGPAPIRMADEDLARIPLAAFGPPPTDEAREALGPFRRLIESLDLDGIG